MTILEIIEAHQYEPISDRLRVASCSCGGWQDEMPYKLRNHFEAHRAHLAEVLETHQQEQQARAWSDGFHKGRKTENGSHVSTWPRNPYRTNQPTEDNDGR